MILVIGSIRTSRQSFSKLVGNGSRSLEVLFDFMINFLISASVAKVKVFIKKFMSYEGCTFRSSLSSGCGVFSTVCRSALYRYSWNRAKQPSRN